MFIDERTEIFFAYFGLVVFVYYSFKLLRKIFNNIGTFAFGLGSVDFKKYGSWAVVTGCTDGIGKSYAEQLAKKGLNIVLISRNLEKLQKQSFQIKNIYKIQTLIIAADFTSNFFLIF
jgi:17beta-estradiol 17-dehydrogenase / very-long-chain 3-oxoacyl-CoA reductase